MLRPGLKNILGPAEFSAGLTFADAEEITQNFSPRREFARGPYGRFYRGSTRDGQPVSVLLLGADMAPNDDGKLRQELDKLSTLDHRNFARLFGYCCGKKYRALCFEDLGKGSLHRYISDESNGLSWCTRYRIIKGVYEALKYIIHVGLGEPVNHFLLETSTILLDETMEPKLVALGSCTCGGLYDRKYLAPEFQDTSVDLTEASIFGLGVVMMEIMTGPVSYFRISHMAHPQFINQVQENWRKRMQQTYSGSELEFRCQQVQRCITIALKCVDPDRRAYDRPSIMEIISQLSDTERYIGQTEVDWRDVLQVDSPTLAKDLLTRKKKEEAYMSAIQASIYRDIEKQLTDLDFQQWNKDLTPLKQIMDSMQVKELMENQNPEEASNVRNEGSNSKQKSSLLRMDGKYIRELKVLEHTVNNRREPPNNLRLMLLQLITKNFSEELIIGRGGCGVVYKGILTNGIIIAVKKLFNSHTIDDNMFHQEVKSMIMVDHQNTVRFLGYCSHTEEKAIELDGKVIMGQIRERLLCFEYIGNGSLDSHLSDELRGLEWHTRYKIIQGICEGLQHLHKEKHIIHMDLKPANILLDDHMVPKITDFGLSRLDEKSHTMSADRLLSLGYCAPEYMHCGKRSSKSDIYSLGVIIMELVTGSRRNPCSTKVQRRWKHRWNKSGKDTELGYLQVAKCLDLAQRCIQMDPVDRPYIWVIIDELNKMESSDVYIGGVREYLELLDMLGIEPLEVYLTFELNKQMSCSIELTNDTDDYFAFRISTTSLHPYRINPNKDILPPRSKCSVTITLQALEKALTRNQSRDEFSVQSTRVDGSLTATDITGSLFREHPGKVVDDVNLVVVLDVQTLPGDG